MIVEMKMYGCKCDKCGKQWENEWNGIIGFTDECGIKDTINDSEWQTDGDKHYCPDCIELKNE